MLSIGFLINPYAGIGGPMALKGSDGVDVGQLLSQGAQFLSAQRAAVALQPLRRYKEAIRWLTSPTIMGEQVLSECGFEYEVMGVLPHEHTQASDTEAVVQALVAAGVDLLLFVGGDGTARNVVDALQASHAKEQLTLGIPAGVKMHSGVYTVSPQAATEVIVALIEQQAVSTAYQEVRDIDEQALREGRLNSSYYGELRVPNDQRYVQQVKNTSRPDEEAMQMEIAAGIVDDMSHDTLYIIGCGSTPKAIMDELGLPNTLLGIDVVLGREVIEMDVNAIELEMLLESYPHHPVQLLLTAIGGQGHIIGRGNQQISPRVLQRVGLSQVMVLITPAKLAELDHRPLLIDSGDSKIDRQWSRLMTVYTGYQQTAVYPLSSGS